MLSNTITSVDDRNRGVLGSRLGGSDRRVSKDDSVSVASYGSDGVGQRLSLGDRRSVDTDRGHLSTTSLHGGLKRSRGSGRRLKEEVADDPTLEGVDSSVSLDLSPHLRSQTEDSVEILSGVVLDGQDVSSVERRVRLESPEPRSGDSGQIGEGGDLRDQAGRERLEGRGPVELRGRHRGVRLDGRSASRERSPVVQLPGSGTALAGEISSERDGGADAIDEEGLAVVNNSVDTSVDGLLSQRRPVLGDSKGRLPVDIDLNRGRGLFGKVEDGPGVVVESEGDVLQRKPTVLHSREKQGDGLLDTSQGRDDLLEIETKLVGDATDGEGVNDSKVVPKSLLVVLGRKAGGSREVPGREEKRVDSHITSDRESFLLAESNELDIILSLDVGDMDLSAVKTGEQKDRGQIGRLGVGHDRLLSGPSSKVRRNGGDLVGVGLEGSGNEERSSSGSGRLGQSGSVVAGGRDPESIVTVSLVVRVGLSDLKRNLVLDLRFHTLGKNLDHGETTSDGSLGHLGEVVGTSLGHFGNERLDTDQPREAVGLVRSLEVDIRDLERRVSNKGLEEKLGTLDVVDERDSKVDRESSRLVTAGDVSGGSSVSVLGGKVDVKVDEVVGKVLLQGVLGLLRVVGSILSEVLEVLDRDSVLLKTATTKKSEKSVPKKD